MRNLKRALSLAMASVMLVGMMAVGAGAAEYTDADKVTHTEAAEVLKAVGVMIGDDNGNFNPDKSVTRAEMAVVMSNLLDLNVANYKGTSPFTDVPDWAEPYVAACYANGITSGASATTYNPNGNVKASEAALMLLKALGYFQYASDFGESWELAVAKQASKIDLWGDLDVSVDTQLTRDQVATLALSALKATTVEATKNGSTIVVGDITITGEVKYEKVESTATYKNAIGKVEGDTQYLELGEKLYKGDLKLNNGTDAKLYDDFGRPANRWAYKNKTIGDYAKEADLTYTAAVKGKTIYADLGKPSFDEDKTEYFVDGYKVKDSDLASGDTLAGLIDSDYDTDLKFSGKGVLTEVYLDTDGEGRIVIVATNQYLAKAVSDYDSSDKELDIEVQGLNGGKENITLKLEDFASIVNYDEDDYMLVTVYTNDIGDADFKVSTISSVETVQDVTVSSYKNTDYVTAGGTKYSYNATAKKDAGALGYDLMQGNDKYSLNGSSYTLYLDQHGYVVGVEGYEDAARLTDYVLIKDAKGSGFDVLAKAVFMDGTSKTITIDKVDNKDVDGVTGDPLAGSNSLDKGKFYTFKVNKNGDYNLTTVKYKQGSYTETKIDTKANGAATPIGNNLVANSSTVFVADDTVFTGVKNAPLTDKGTVYYLMNKASGGYLMAVVTDKSGQSVTDASKLVYVTDVDKYGEASDADDNEYYVYTAVIDGKKGELNANQKIDDVGLYKITSYTNGYANVEKIEDDGEQYAIHRALDTTKGVAYKNGVMTVNYANGETGSYVLADDVQIFTVKDGTTTASSKTPSGLNNIDYSTYSKIDIVKKTDDLNAEVVAVYLVRP